MHLSELFRSTGVKLAIAFAAFFCIASLATAGVAYYLIAEDLDSWLDRSLSETSSYIANEFKEGGEKALAESVDQHAVASEGDNEIFLLANRDGRKIAGNVDKFKTGHGWYDAESHEFGLEGPRHFRVLGVGVGGNTLIVARSDSAVDEIGGIIEKAFGVGAIIMAASALLAGLLIGFRAQRRVETFENTLDAVSLGDMNRRVDVSDAGGDDIDRIARKLNKTLDNLRSAMLSMQHVTVDIAHDLKSPIARLRNRLTDTINGLSSTDQMRAELQDAIDEADQITQTFDSMLRIAQIESGERRRHFANFQLASAVARAADIYGAVVEDRGGKLLTQGDASQAEVFGDEQLILQMIANLIENSLNHCPQPPTIALSMVDAVDKIVLAVADNGQGIPLLEREKVKQRFYRLDKSRSTKGSGLGLALVAAVTNLHGATLMLEDNKPGLTVRVAFPRADKASAQRT